MGASVPEISRFKTGFLSDFGESSGANLFTVVKAEREIAQACFLELSMRSDLPFEGPAETKQSGETRLVLVARQILKRRIRP